MAISINTLKPRQNGRHFADDIFKCIFLDENVWIPIKLHRRVQLKHSSTGSDNGLTPLRRQAIIWNNDGYFTDAYMRHSSSLAS